MAASPLRAALKSLGASSTLMEQAEAVTSLLVYARNIIEFPNEEKYRRVRVSNIHFYERLGHLEKDHGLMAALGFVPDGDYLGWDEARPPEGEEVRAELRAAVALLEERERELAAAFAELPPVLDEDAHAFTSVAGGASHCDQGKRHNMEDAEVIVDSFMGAGDCGFFGLYDGHGGRETVDFVVKALHLNLEKLLAEEPTADMHQAFTRAYATTDGQVRRANILQSGTTAVTCVIRNEPDGGRTLYSANVGDSRAILVRDGKATRLTIDHKPSLPEEEKRIKDCGGFVIDRRVNGVLAISRALGDFMLKSSDVVSHVPYCQTVPLAGASHLILACDGVWDVLTDQQAVDFVLEQLEADEAGDVQGPALNHKLKRACKALVDEALLRKSMDNITAMILKL